MRYRLHKGELVPAHLVPRQPVARSSLPCPAIRTDGMDATWNPVNGQTYESRSAYERAVKDAGCVIAGDDSSLSRRPDPEPVGGLEEDIKRAIHELSD